MAQIYRFGKLLSIPQAPVWDAMAWTVFLSLSPEIEGWKLGASGQSETWKLTNFLLLIVHQIPNWLLSQTRWLVAKCGAEKLGSPLVFQTKTVYQIKSYNYNYSTSRYDFNLIWGAAPLTPSPDEILVICSSRNPGRAESRYNIAMILCPILV